MTDGHYQLWFVAPGDANGGPLGSWPAIYPYEAPRDAAWRAAQVHGDGTYVVTGGPVVYIFRYGDVPMDGHEELHLGPPPDEETTT